MWILWVSLIFVVLLVLFIPLEYWEIDRKPTTAIKGNPSTQPTGPWAGVVRANTTTSGGLLLPKEGAINAQMAASILRSFYKESKNEFASEYLSVFKEDLKEYRETLEEIIRDAKYHIKSEKEEIRFVRASDDDEITKQNEIEEINKSIAQAESICDQASEMLSKFKKDKREFLVKWHAGNSLLEKARSLQRKSWEIL